MSVLTRPEAFTARMSQRKPRKWTRYRNSTFYLFASPWIVGFLIIGLIPLIYGFAISFTTFDGLSPARWIGLRNYTDALQSSETWFSLGRSLIYALVTIPLGLIGSLGLALLLNRSLKGIGIFRTIYYLPATVPVVASALMWKIMFARDSGALNGIIELFHGTDVSWLQDPAAFDALVIMMLWGLGGGTIIWLAGLQGIPQELQDAARVDGANAWHVFRVVTIPLLTPLIFFQVVMGLIGSLQTFIQPLLLSPQTGVVSAGAVPRGNYLYMVYAYEQFFNFQRFRYGSALLWILFAVILLMTLALLKSSSSWVYYEVDREKGK